MRDSYDESSEITWEEFEADARALLTTRPELWSEEQEEWLERVSDALIALFAYGRRARTRSDDSKRDPTSGGRRP